MYLCRVVWLVVCMQVWLVVSICGIEKNVCSM